MDRLPLPVVDTIIDCMNELSADPYRDSRLRLTLVVPLYRTSPGAYLCGTWAIVYQVRADQILVIEAISDLFY